MRKRKLSIYDIGRLPSVAVENKSGFQTKKEFLEQEERDRIAAEQSAERRRTAPLREAEMELREAAREASARIAMYWSQDLKELALNGLELTPVDLAGVYEPGPRNNVAEVATWKEFQENLASFRCSLSDAGGERLGAYLCSLAYHRGVSLTSVSNWATALERLHSLKVFQSGELAGYKQAPTEPERHAVVNPDRRTMDDPLAAIENLNLDNREDNLRVKQLATNDFFSREFAGVGNQWHDWLYTTFGYVLTDDARKAAGQWWERNPTQNPLRGESWTSLRLNLVKKGVMPLSCLTREEILNQTIEQSSDRSDSYEVRRNLRQQIRELAQK